MSIQATVFLRPNGRQEVITVTNVNPDDANFLNTRGIKISMEDAPGLGQTVYADYGAVTEDGEPEEIIVFSRGRSCEETLAEVRVLVEEALASLPSRGI